MTGELPLDAEDYSELAAFLEKELGAHLARGASTADADELRLRLVFLYTKVLAEASRAIRHAEELLDREPVDPRALEAASVLLEHRLLSAPPPRVAELLSKAYERSGSVASEVVSLAAELKVAPPDRRARAARRLAELRFRVLEDPDGALELLEPIVLERPGDDEARSLYIEIASSLGAQLAIAEKLAAAVVAALGAPSADPDRGDPAEIRGRVGLDVGVLYLQEAELPRARSAFAEVVRDGAGPAALAAAHRLIDLETDAGDPDLVGPALERVARADPDSASRVAAATRLLTLHAAKPLDEGRLATAYEALVDSPRGDEALVWLASLHHRRGDWQALSGVYRKGALRATDPADARALALKSITVIPDEGGEERAIEAWRWFAETFGPNREAHAELIALFEKTERWRDLSRMLAAEIELAKPHEKAVLLARLGGVLWGHLGDAEGALAVFRQCLAIDAGNAAARVGMEELIRRALRADPSSLEHLGRLDALLGSHETPQDRVARYDEALKHTKAHDRRRSLLRVIAGIRQGPLNDLRAAADAWRQVLAESPSDAEAFRALLDLSAKLDDVGPMLDAVRVGHDVLTPGERNEILLRAAIAALQRGQGSAAAAVGKQLAEDPTADATLLRTLADTAASSDQRALQRRAFELMSVLKDARARQYGLEHLGDVLFEAGERAAAAESWRPAALLLESEDGRAQALYERILDAQPGDREAAEHLVDLYGRTDDWLKLPPILQVLVRSGDPVRAARALAKLEESAARAGSVDTFLTLADELVARFEGSSTTQTRPNSAASAEGLAVIRRARARALRADPARREEAARALRESIEAGGAAEDVAEFEAFIESNPSAEARHVERRWLYQWRVAHAPRPADVLMDWAKAEEEHGDPGAAAALYARISETDARRAEALECMCRLKLLAGDFEGGLEALREVSESDRPAVSLRVGHMLVDEFGRPAEAASAVAPLLVVRAVAPAARQLLRRMLRDEGARDDVVVRLDEMARRADGAGALRVLELLLEAREETSRHPELRRRWHEMAVEQATDRGAGLAAALRGAQEMPETMALWDAAERLAREAKTPSVVSRAYHQTIVEKVVDAEVAEALARRMVAFEGETPSDASRVVDALRRVLELAPGTRWALDRVKLALGSQARWDELFRLYDGAIAAARDDRERRELLDEAAFAARDLAAEPDRAITYLELIHALRPDDEAIDATLERLYERQGRKVELIDLLNERVGKAVGFKLRELRCRIASLRVDLGDVDSAVVIVERILEDDAFVPEVIELLERIAAMPPAASSASQDIAIDLLRGHYEAAGRTPDLVRIAERRLALAPDGVKKTRCLRELVALRIVAADGEAAVFRRVLPNVEADAGGDPRLAKAAYRAVLVRAVDAWKRAASADEADRRPSAGDADPAPPASDAEEGAWAAAQALAALHLQGQDPAASLRLLVRVRQFPFSDARRRELLRQAALVRADRLGDTSGAIDAFSALFDEDGGDAAASASLERYVELLDAQGRHAKLAALWEQQAALRAKSDNRAVQSACWQRAAVLWEKDGDVGRAVAAYRHGAALESEAAFEALARIHTATEAWAEATEPLAWLVGHSPPRARCARALRLAEAYVHLGDRARARACLEEALGGAAETNDRNRACDRLLDLYREDQVWVPLAALLGAEARRVLDAQRKVALALEAADILSRRLDDRAGAAQLLEAAVSWVPEDGSLRIPLADALEALDRWDDVVAVLGAQIAWYRDRRSPDRAATHHRLAAALVRCGRTQEALGHLRLAAEMHPSSPAILFDLGRVALDAGELELSESTYRVLLLALQRPAEEPGTPLPYRAAILLDMSEVASRKGDSVRSRDLVESAFDLAMEDRDDPGRFERALAARGRFDLMARAVERRVERAPTLAARAVALGDLVTLWKEHLGSAADLGGRIVSHAQGVARDLEAGDTSDGSPWTALSDVYARMGDRERTASLLEMAIARTAGKTGRATLRLRLAKILLGEPPQPDAAIAVLTAAHGEDPDDGAVTSLLVDSLEAAGRFDELVTICEGRLKALAPGDRRGEAPAWVEAAERLGRVLERAGRPGEALRVYESVLDREALDSDTLAVLDERLEALSSGRLADCVERRVTRDEGTSPELTQRLLSLRDALGDPSGIARALRLGVTRDPGNADLRDRLLHAKVTRSTADDIVGALDAALAARPADAELLALRARLREGAKDDEGAVADLEAAAVADAGQLEPLAELLRRAAGRRKGAAADEYAMRLVDVLTRQQKPADARVELERVLARSPKHPGGLRAMAALAFAEEKWDEAAAAYGELLRLADKAEGEQVVVAATALAEACERAGRLVDAREALEQAIAAFPEDVRLMERLVRVYEQAGEWSRLAGMLSARAEAHADKAEKARLLLRAAGLLTDGGRAPSAALDAIARARAAGADPIETALAYARAQVALQQPGEAIAALNDAVARTRGKRSPLVASLYLEIGRAHLAVDELVEAFEALKAGLAMNGRACEMALLLGLVAIDLGELQVAERALSAVTTMPSRKDGSADGADPPSRAVAYYHLASMAHEKGDIGKARRLVTKAVGGDPGNAAARALLDRIEDRAVVARA